MSQDPSSLLTAPALAAREPVARPLDDLPAPAPLVATAPRKVTPPVAGREAYAATAALSTPALVGVGHAGTRYPTAAALQLAAELAVAHTAVATTLPPGWLASQGLLALDSQAPDASTYLLRPDLGRRLAPESRARLDALQLPPVDAQIILADGLSAGAAMETGMALLAATEEACAREGLTLGPRMGARFARVWLEDEIGQLARAKVAILLLGERPGLGTGDGLSAYLVYDPQPGRTDADRNMLCNIHARGIAPVVAARRIALLAREMIQQKTSGVALDLTPITAALGESAGTGYRAPPVRRWCVGS